MESLLFVAIMACLASVIVWYIQNASVEAPASVGLFAIAVEDGADQSGVPAALYMMRPERGANLAHQTASQRVRYVAAQNAKENAPQRRYSVQSGRNFSAQTAGQRHIVREDRQVG